MNWFVLSCGLLQLGGGLVYFATGRPKFGMLMILYSSTNFLLCVMKGE